MAVLYPDWLLAQSLKLVSNCCHLSVDGAAPIGDVPPTGMLGKTSMMLRPISSAALLVWFIAFSSVAVHAGDDVPSKTGTTTTATSHISIEEFSAQSRKILNRNPRRVPVYRNTLRPNAVRVCNAYYVQEYRPSGTVIVPRMNCFWRG